MTAESSPPVLFVVVIATWVAAVACVLYDWGYRTGTRTTRVAYERYVESLKTRIADLEAERTEDEEPTPVTHIVKLSAEEIRQAIVEYVQGKVDGTDAAGTSDVVLRASAEDGTSPFVLKDNLTAEVECDLG